MMREIKFRGKKESNGEWVYGYYYVRQRGGHTLDVHKILSLSDGNVYNIKEETVGQYIGMKDKDGKEIYEEDVADCDGFGVCKVGWYSRDGCFICYQDDKGGVPFSPSLLKVVKIVGNVSDNPRLLEGKA